MNQMLFPVGLNVCNNDDDAFLKGWELLPDHPRLRIRHWHFLFLLVEFLFHFLLMTHFNLSQHHLVYHINTQPLHQFIHKISSSSNNYPHFYLNPLRLDSQHNLGVQVKFQYHSNILPLWHHPSLIKSFPNSNKELVLA